MTTFRAADQEVQRKHRKAREVRELIGLEDRLPRAQAFFVSLRPTADNVEQEQFQIPLDPTERDTLRAFVENMIGTKIDARLATEGWERDV